MLKHSDLVSVNAFYERRIGDKKLLIDKCDGHWVFSDEAGSKFIHSLLSERPASGFTKKEAKVLNYLWRANFLKANGKKKTVVRSLLCGKPFYLVLNLSLSCNLKCRYCYVGANLNGPVMPLQVGKVAIRKFLSICKTRSVILFHGGEPLAQFNLLRQLQKYSKKTASLKGKKISYAVQTNGTIMNETIADYIKKEKMNISVSLDVTEQAHNFCRPTNASTGSYSTVMCSLKLLNSKKIPVRLITVVNKLNAGSLDLLVNYAKELKIASLNCNPLFFAGRGKLSRPLGVSNAEYFKGMYKLIRAIIKYNKNNCAALLEMNTHYRMKNITDIRYQYMCQSIPCGAGTAVIAIAPNGDAYPCDEFITDEQFKCGNVMRDSFNKILQSKICKALRSRRIASLPHCRDCAWSHFCAGGCPSQIYFSSGTLAGRNPFCAYEQLMIPKMFKMVLDSKAKYV